MARVPLKCGAWAVVDEADLPLVEGKVWRIQWRYVDGKPYAPQAVVSGGNGAPLLMHRAIAGVDGLVIDHINGDPLDNRRSNLRACTPTENGFNRRIYRNNTSGIKGVYATGDGGWRAEIRARGKKVSLGRFNTKAEAAAAYALAAPIYHGEFARIA